MMNLVIATEYTQTPGARYIKEGTHSGEDFRINYLEPRFKLAQEKGEILLVDLDGGYGYPPSFLDEAFGGLTNIYGKDVVLKGIQIKSDDEPSLIDIINEYINEAEKKKISRR